MSLWPPRFTSFTSSSSGNANRPPPACPPQEPPLSSRPTQSSSPRQQPHTRAVSHPLPRIFGKKKSAPVLRSIPLDEHLVPVLDAGPSGGPSLDKPIGGRKKDEELITRQCMCCDNKVRFPRDLNVFRCTNCLTINDLEPYVKQDRDPKSSTYPGQQQGPRREFTVRRTRLHSILTRVKPYCHCQSSVVEPSLIAASSPTSKHDAVEGQLHHHSMLLPLPIPLFVATQQQNMHFYNHPHASSSRLLRRQSLLRQP
jgi:hypothetical protein